MIDQVVAHSTEVFEKVIFCETSGDAATSSFREGARRRAHVRRRGGVRRERDVGGSKSSSHQRPANGRHPPTLPHAALPKPIILKWEAYSDLAKEVLEQGFTFEIDEQGRPHITIERRAEMGEGDMDVELIIEEALRLGCKDLEALDALRWGARAFCDTPLATTYGPNHAGALEHAAEMEGMMSDELRWGWIVSSKHPPSCRSACGRAASSPRSRKWTGPSRRRATG